MSANEGAVAAFLAQTGWQGAELHPIAGDASTRRYFRLLHPRRGRAVLVDSATQPVEPWLLVREKLAASGIRVPALFAADPLARLLLLEDVGDRHLDEAIENRDDERRLYGRAAELLCALRSVPTCGLPPLDPPTLCAQLELFLDEVAGALCETAKEEFRAIWRALLPPACAGPQRFVHRDLHARNLMVLDDDKLVVIDFQDAFEGPLLYDLVSLVQDVRRDLDPMVEEELVARVLAAHPRVPPEQAELQMAVLGAQRALRILGVFTRLAGPGGKPAYRRFLPRVRARLARNLTHPALAPLARWWNAHAKAIAFLE